MSDDKELIATVTDIMERRFLNLLDARRKYAESIGLDVALIDLLDGLSLILSEDTETGLFKFLEEKSEVYCNVRCFLNAYERAAVEHSEMLTAMPGRPVP